MSWQVPGYRHRMHLGDGTTGRVHLAVHEESGDLVVIKYLNAPSAAIDAIRAEIEQLSALDGTYFVRIREVVEEDGNVAIVTDPVSGVALRAMLRDHGALAVEAALVVYRDTLTGLSQAHAAGIVHGDHRPENVIIDAAGASVMTDVRTHAWTSREVSLGTGVYLAPERWHGEAPGAPADVYAATVTLFESLAGEPPYWEESQLLTLRYQHEQGEIPQGPIAVELREIIRGGLAKDPSSRYDATAMLELVEVVAAGEYGRDWVRKGRALLAERVALVALPFGADGVTDVSVERDTELVELDDYYSDETVEITTSSTRTTVTAAEDIVTLAGIESATAGARALDDDDELTEEEERAVAEVESFIEGVTPVPRHEPAISAPQVEEVTTVERTAEGLVRTTTTVTRQVVTEVRQRGAAAVEGAVMGAGGFVATEVVEESVEEFAGAASTATEAAVAAGAKQADVVNVARAESERFVTVTETVEVVTVIERSRHRGAVDEAVGAASVAVTAAVEGGARTAEVVSVRRVEADGYITIIETIEVVTIVVRRRRHGGAAVLGGLAAGAVAGAVVGEVVEESAGGDQVASGAASGGLAGSAGGGSAGSAGVAGAEAIIGLADVATDAAVSAGARSVGVVDTARAESERFVTVTETIEVVTVIEKSRLGGAEAVGVASVAVAAAVDSGAKTAEIVNVSVVETEEYLTITETVTIVTVIHRRRHHGGLVAGAVIGAGAVGGALLVEGAFAADGAASGVVEGGAAAGGVAGGMAGGENWATEEIVAEEVVTEERRYVDGLFVGGAAGAAGYVGGELVEEAVVVTRSSDDTVIMPAVAGAAAGGLVGFAVGEEITEVDESFAAAGAASGGLVEEEITEVDEEFVAVGAFSGGLAGEEIADDEEDDGAIVLAGAAAGGLAGAAAGGYGGEEITAVDQDTDTAIIPVVVGAAAGGLIGAAAGGPAGEEEDAGGIAGGVRRHHPGGGTAAAGAGGAAAGAAGGGVVGAGGTGVTDRGRGWVRRHPWFSTFIVLIIIAGCIFGGIAVGGGFNNPGGAGNTLPSQSPSPTPSPTDTGGPATGSPSGAPGSLPNGGPSGGTGNPSGQPSGQPSGSPTGTPTSAPPSSATPTPTKTHKPKPTPSPTNPCAPPTHHHGVTPVGPDGVVGYVTLRC